MQGFTWIFSPSMKHPLNIIGPQVRMLRETAQWTQDQLAARCQRLGLDITRETLAKIETAACSVVDHEMIFLALALKIRIEELFPPGSIILVRKILKRRK